MKIGLLNKTVTIQAYSQTSNVSGDLSNTLTNVETNVLMRITTNKALTDNKGDTFGRFIASSHLGFCLTGVNVHKNNIVLDGAIKYKVDYVDPIPGGKLDSHQQIYMTLVE